MKKIDKICKMYVVVVMISFILLTIYSLAQQKV